MILLNMIILLFKFFECIIFYAILEIMHIPSITDSWVVQIKKNMRYSKITDVKNSK
jgi:hypothetical protein